MASEDEFEQLEFRDGELVSPDGAGAGDADPVRPNEESGFRLAVKPDALEVNAALAGVTEEHGEALSFGSRAKAERFARRLSAESGALRVQAAAPNDPGDADGYLLAEHDPDVREPAAVDGDTWTFDVGANVYGALGEAVVTSGARPPALAYYVERDLDVDADDLETGLRVRVRSGERVTTGRGRNGWVPDCRVEARDGWNGEVLETYLCEIKTGNASFERSQRAAMRALAREERVLTIRVLIEDLPDRYAVRIREVEPPEE